MKTLNDYTVVVAPNDGEFLAYIPAVRGCHALAATPEDARRELADVFEMFLDMWREYGETPPDDVSAELLLAVS